MSDEKQQTVVEFSDCRTAAECMAKFLSWYDNHCIEQVRAHASRLMVENEDPEEITAQVDQMLDFLAKSRDDARAQFEWILDQAGRP